MVARHGYGGDRLIVSVPFKSFVPAEAVVDELVGVVARLAQEHEHLVTPVKGLVDKVTYFGALLIDVTVNYEADRDLVHPVLPDSSVRDQQHVTIHLQVNLLCCVQVNRQVTLDLKIDTETLSDLTD